MPLVKKKYKKCINYGVQFQKLESWLTWFVKWNSIFICIPLEVESDALSIGLRYMAGWLFPIICNIFVISYLFLFLCRNTTTNVQNSKELIWRLYFKRVYVNLFFCNATKLSTLSNDYPNNTELENILNEECTAWDYYKTNWFLIFCSARCGMPCYYYCYFITVEQSTYIYA